MDEVKTAYRCPKCERAVLNRRVPHCLFCNAALPASMLLAGAAATAAVTTHAAIASTDFQLEPMAANQPTPTLAQDLQGAGSDLASTAGDAVVTIVSESVDVIDLATGAVEVAGEVLSGIGDLLGGLADMF